MSNFQHVYRSERDWLVVELTMANGVNVYRTEDAFRAADQYQGRFNAGGWYVLALYRPNGVCIKREWR